LGPEYTIRWLFEYVDCEYMKRALKDVGHHNLDGPALKGALESIKDFDVNRMAKVAFGPEDRTGVQEYALYQMHNEKIIGLSDWQQAPILAPYKMQYGTAAMIYLSV
jgi:hypothetical protein